MAQRPHEVALLLVGDLNTNLAGPGGDRRNKTITDKLSDVGLEDISGHFLLCHNSWARNG